MVGGAAALAICNTILDVQRIEWLNNEVLIKQGVSEQRLDLEFSLVNDSIHGEVYTCRVTLTNGTILQQSFTIDVECKLIVCSGTS